MERVRKRQLMFIGYIVRAEELKCDCLLEKVDGTRVRRRQLTKYMDSIVRFLCEGQTTASVLRLARERRNWRSIVDNTTR